MDERPTKRRGPITLLMTSGRFRQRLAVAAIALPILYVAGFGPACWWFSTRINGENYAPRIYWPIGRSIRSVPRPVGTVIVWYANVLSTQPVKLPTQWEWYGAWVSV